jgi:heme-degrading monooxygenase HmoA
MYCVTWTYKMPEGYSAEQIGALFEKTAHIYLGVPGLIRKYFGRSDDCSRVVGIYLWETKADADAFYSPEWSRA